MASPTRVENVVTHAGGSAAGGPVAVQAGIPSLDGLRAISIMLVLPGHGIGFLEGRSFAFRALFLHADLGVRIFFIISGFLITNLLLNERSEFGTISLRLFYIRRAPRILPASCLFIGCVALLSKFGIVSAPARDWAYVLLCLTPSTWGPPTVLSGW